EAVRMLPGREVPTDEASLAAAFDALRERFDIDTRRSALAQALTAGLAPAGIEYYLPLFFKSTATLFDYLPAGTLPLVDEGALEAADTFWKQADDRHEQLRHDIERPILPPAELWLTPDALRERLNQGDRIELCGEAHPRHAQAAKLGDQPAPSLPLALRDAVPGASLREFIASYPGRTLIAADSAGRREALLEMLDAAGLQPAVLPDFPSFASGPAAADGSPRFAIAVAPLDDGFALDAPQLAILTERQLFPERAAQPRRRKRAGREPEAIIRDLGELAEGAPIVHEDHGVGRYRGLVTLEAGGQPGEYLD